ncbi:MAG TPA: hypothetical protein VMT56_01655 [Candidatus Bathyarchaeia archaeon]|nr:hypothetical protein [Candidatus Bathyarchaeia archaeon]
MHHTIVPDLQSQLAVHEMFDGQGAPDLRDQSPEQHKHIVRRITDDLEMIAGRTAVAKLEGVESDPRAEQVGAKMKFVNLPGAVGETHRLEPGMLESLQSGRLCHFSVEALAAEASVSALNGSVVHDIVARCGLAATVATYLFAQRELSWVHFHEHTRQKTPQPGASNAAPSTPAAGS